MVETVGLRIKQIAISRALAAGEEAPTMQAIADSLGISYESLRKWTTSATAPNRKRAALIAAKLGVPVSAFMLGAAPAEDDQPAPSPPYSAAALRVAAIYDQVSPKDRRHIDAAADTAASSDDPPLAASSGVAAPSVARRSPLAEALKGDRGLVHTEQDRARNVPTQAPAAGRGTRNASGQKQPP